MAQHEIEDFQALIDIGQADGEAFGHTAQDGGVNVVRAVRGAKYEDAGCGACGEAVP
jgi:hypothetical protein